MEGYIDIHNHIIPKVDDGAHSMNQALRMLEIAFSEGIRTVIATPHICYRKGEDRLSKLKVAFEELKINAEEQFPELKLYMGSEIFYSQDTVYGLQKNDIPTLGNTSYVLVEFQPSCEYRYLKSSIQNLIIGGYKPVIAHIERYYVLRKDMKLVDELILMGAYIQSNASGIGGEDGRELQRFIKKLLKRKLLHFVATDSHGDEIRPPRIRECIDTAKKKYGEEYAADIFIHNGRKLLKDQYI